MNTEVKSAMLFRSGNIPDFSLFHLILDRHMEITRKANEISGTPPLTFSAGGTTLKNYRIYGNTVNGTSVGDEVTNSANEHYEEYCIPISLGGQTTNIYLSEPLRKIGTDTDYTDYKSKKIIRKILKVVVTSDNIRKISDQTWYIAKTHPSLKHVINGNDIVNIYCNCLPNGSTSNTNCCFINNTGTIRFNTSEPYNTVNDVLNAFGGIFFLVIYETPQEQTINLPPLQTGNGSNVLSVQTSVQPSQVDISGKISSS